MKRKEMSLISTRKEGIITSTKRGSLMLQPIFNSSGILINQYTQCSQSVYNLNLWFQFTGCWLSSLILWDEILLEQWFSKTQMWILQLNFLSKGHLAKCGYILSCHSLSEAELLLACSGEKEGIGTSYKQGHLLQHTI